LNIEFLIDQYHVCRLLFFTLYDTQSPMTRAVPMWMQLKCGETTELVLNV